MTEIRELNSRASGDVPRWSRPPPLLRPPRHSPRPAAGVGQTRLIREAVTGCYLALLIGNNDELLPVVRPSLIFSGDPESLSGKKSHLFTALRLNNWPQKCLGVMTPNQLFWD